MTFSSRLNDAPVYYHGAEVLDGTSVAHRESTIAAGFYTISHGERVPIFAAREMATCRTAGSGDAADPATWEGGRKPAAGDIACICAGHRVLVRTVLESRILGVEGGAALEMSEGGALVQETLFGHPHSSLKAVRGKILFSGAPPYDAVLDPGQHGRGLITLGDIVLEGTEIRSLDPQMHRAHILVAGEEGVTRAIFRKCTLANLGRTTAFVAFDAVDAKGRRNVRGRYSLFFRFRRGQQEASDCTLTGCAMGGIVFFGQPGGIASGNTIDGAEGAGIALVDATNTRVENNTIRNIDGLGRLLAPFSPEERDNYTRLRLDWSRGDGIWAASGVGNVLQNNAIESCAFAGIVTHPTTWEPAGACTIARNTIRRCPRGIAPWNRTSDLTENRIFDSAIAAIYDYYPGPTGVLRGNHLEQTGAFVGKGAGVHFDKVLPAFDGGKIIGFDSGIRSWETSFVQSGGIRNVHFENNKYHTYRHEDMHYRRKGYRVLSTDSPPAMPIIVWFDNCTYKGATSGVDHFLIFPLYNERLPYLPERIIETNRNGNKGENWRYWHGYQRRGAIQQGPSHPNWQRAPRDGMTNEAVWREQRQCVLGELPAPDAAEVPWLGGDFIAVNHPTPGEPLFKRPLAARVDYGVEALDKPQEIRITRCDFERIEGTLINTSGAFSVARYGSGGSVDYRETFVIPVPAGEMPPGGYPKVDFSVPTPAELRKTEQGHFLIFVPQGFTDESVVARWVLGRQVRGLQLRGSPFGQNGVAAAALAPGVAPPPSELPVFLARHASGGYLLTSNLDWGVTATLRARDWQFVCVVGSTPADRPVWESCRREELGVSPPAPPATLVQMLPPERTVWALDTLNQALSDIKYVSGDVFASSDQALDWVISVASGLKEQKPRPPKA